MLQAPSCEIKHTVVVDIDVLHRVMSVNQMLLARTATIYESQNDDYDNFNNEKGFFYEQRRIRAI